MGTYLVDGDNLIGAWGGPRRGDDRRAEVVRHLHTACEGQDSTCVVVFDPGATAPEETTRVRVRVASLGETADDIIRSFVDAALDTGALTVVTSDKPVYSYARTRGARVLRTHEWMRAFRREG
jgi:predicted RNA-binding protein with PIN domain